MTVLGWWCAPPKATSSVSPLANRCPDTIDEAMQAAYDGLDQVASLTDGTAV